MTPAPPSGTTPLHLACSVDENYAPHCAAMLHSVLDQSPATVVHFLHAPGMKDEVIVGLRRLVEGRGARFDAIAVTDPRLDRLPIAEFGRVAWHRILLPELYPSLDRVLYLDGDVIVRHALEPLWSTPLHDSLVAAVRNVTEPKHLARIQALDIPPSQPYFNAGVLLMNLASMRESDCVARIFDHAARHRERLTWVDQDSLNHVLGARCHFLHPRWNCQNSLFSWPEARRVFGDRVVDEAIADPHVLHFEGPGFAKPWHYLNRHPFRSEYWRHARATPFSPRMEGRTLANVWLRHSRPVTAAAVRAAGVARRAARRLRAMMS